MGIFRSPATSKASTVGVVSDAVIVGGTALRLLQRRGSATKAAPTPSELALAAFALFRIVQWARRRKS